jgi:hypothetical protein
MAPIRESVDFDSTENQQLNADKKYEADNFRDTVRRSFQKDNQQYN